MARRRPPQAPSGGSGELILPVELLRRDLGGADYTAMVAERRQWFLDRQVDLGDTSAVLAIVNASGRAHGIPYGSLDRAWVRSVGLEEWRRIHGSRGQE
jgi:hypothetical protein